MIGAGACGICAATYPLEVGFDVTVFLGNARPPDTVSMHCSIAECTAWYTGQYQESIRHSVEEEYVLYLGDHKTALRAMKRALWDARPRGA